MSGDLYIRILEDHKELSSLPQTLAEVLRVIQDDNASAHDLAEVIMRDPALTAKLLRVVNSPFYGMSREVTTLSQAVVTLGMRAVSALVLSTSVYDMSGECQSSIDRVRFWRHSLEVAIASRLIADAIRYPRREEAFIAGLLHDLGLLVLEKSFEDKFASVWSQASSCEELVELEENSWGTNHARVGQFLLEQWRIPVIICEAVGQHHSRFSRGTHDADLRLRQIVALANKISKHSIAGIRRDLPHEADNIEILRDNLRLPPERLGPIEEQLTAHTEEQARFLNIDVGPTHGILVEANRMLYRHYHTVESLLREAPQTQEEINQTQIEKASLESLRTITATFNHYINNAVATILGRAQLIELGVKRGEIVDSKNQMPMAIDVIINGVNTIQLVLEELKNLESFRIACYHDETFIIDIENKIKHHLNELRKSAEPETVK